MKKTILLSLVMLGVSACYAQDNAAMIIKSWPSYTTDTTLTLRQIIATCDSQFAQAGYVASADTAADSAETEKTELWLEALLR